MGNRAVIQIKGSKVGIYLHWNGGRDSVEAFLAYAKAKGIRPEPQYGTARLAQIIGNFFGGGLSVGVDVLAHLDCNNGDNGLYIVEDWAIVERKYHKGEEQRGYPLEEMMKAIDEKNAMHFTGGE